MQDLLDPGILRQKLDLALREKNQLLTKVYNRAGRRWARSNTQRPVTDLDGRRIIVAFDPDEAGQAPPWPRTGRCGHCAVLEIARFPNGSDPWTSPSPSGSCALQHATPLSRGPAR